MLTFTAPGVPKRFVKIKLMQFFIFCGTSKMFMQVFTAFVNPFFRHHNEEWQ